MSLSKSVARRLSLMAGSSLAAASLTAFVSAVAALAPNAALAQTATCISVPPPAGNGTDDVVYPAGTYNPGINCTYTGSSATVSTEGPITVSDVAGGTGIDLVATGTGSIIWDSTLGTTANDAQINGRNFTNGPVIDATTDQGDITILVDRVFGSSNSATSANNATHAVRAISASGDIFVQGETFSSGGQSGTTPPGVAGIEARSGGNVTIDASFSPSGRLYGVLAETSGAGDLTIHVGRTTSGSASSSTGSIAGIDATTLGTGDLGINVRGGLGSAGTAIRTNANGDATIDIAVTDQPGGGIEVSTISGSAGHVLDLSTAAGGATTVNVGARGRVVSDISSTNGFLDDTDESLIRAAGAGDLVINNGGWMSGTLDTTASTGNVTFNITAYNGWRSSGISTFGGGDDVLSTAGEGIIWTSTGTDNEILNQAMDETTFDFGGGEDTLRNGGRLVIGEQFPFFSASSLVTIENLEVLENTGVIHLGLANRLVGGTGLENPNAADGNTNDVLRMTGGVFMGGEGSRLILDFNPTGTQTNCVDRNDDNELPGADCLDLRGASTDGVTLVTVDDIRQETRGGYSPDGVVIVDVRGAGTSASGHFVMAPDSDNYYAENGGVIDKGDFFYALVYDPDAQQHKIVGLPGGALQFAPMGHVVQDVWRTASDAVFERHTDRRNNPDSEVGGDVWLRTTGEVADRERIHSVSSADNNFEFDDSFEQRVIAVTSGLDFLLGDDHRRYGLGLTVGYVRADLDYDVSPNSTEMRGMSGGLYATYQAGGFYLDAAATGVSVAMDLDMPRLNLLPAGTVITNNARSYGARAEAGWRLPLSRAVFIEPLASVAYATTDFDDLIVRPSGDPVGDRNLVQFDEAVSLRGGVGARVGAGSRYGPVNFQATLTGRVWNEFDGDSGVTVLSNGPDLTLMDEFTGTFSDLSAALNISDAVDAFSGYVAAGGKFGDDYQATSVSAGLRYSW